jgi:hypothetical protein
MDKGYDNNRVMDETRECGCIPIVSLRKGRPIPLTAIRGSRRPRETSPDDFSLSVECYERLSRNACKSVREVHIVLDRRRVGPPVEIDNADLGHSVGSKPRESVEVDARAALAADYRRQVEHRIAR